MRFRGLGVSQAFKLREALLAQAQLAIGLCIGDDAGGFLSAFARRSRLFTVAIVQEVPTVRPLSAMRPSPLESRVAPGRRVAASRKLRALC